MEVRCQPFGSVDPTYSSRFQVLALGLAEIVGVAHVAPSQVSESDRLDIGAISEIERKSIWPVGDSAGSYRHGRHSCDNPESIVGAHVGTILVA
jgi:hypothetical protein